MVDLQYVVLFPIAAGIILFIFPDRGRTAKGIVALIVSAIVLYYSYRLFLIPSQIAVIIPGLGASSALGSHPDLFMFNLDPLAKTITLFIGFFGFMFALYSLSYMTRDKNVTHYYSFYLITIGSSCGAALSDHFLMFLVFWGILGLTLYKLIRGYDETSSAAAKKTFIMIGASDSVMIFGIGLVWILSGTFTLSKISIQTRDTLQVIAFIALLIGSLTKSGVFPLHTWVPDYAEKAPASSTAVLPASLDKLLGIYFLARITMSLFTLNPWLRLTLLIIGGITTITAVLMALMQHNYKKLLGYHAVSQVGYMVTGFGLGTPIGIAGGIFHMFNNALYKSGLFLTAGAIEKRTGNEELEELSGLSTAMPVTFISALVFALSISGVPPFNGFASKWIIYQAIIEFGKGAGPGNSVWVVWLILAIFGSAMTLASFIKLISGVYLGRLKGKLKGTREVSILMWMPQVIIAIICVGTGIFATKYFVPAVVTPISGNFGFIGIWSSGIITGLVLISLALGFIIYLLGRIKRFRVTEGFMGGETFEEKIDYSAVDFYKTIGNFKPFAFFYRNAEKKNFDVYDGSRNAVLGINRMFSLGHSGVLPLYALWVVLGLIVIAVILIL